LAELAEKFPKVKFLRGVADKIVERYPDQRLPAIFCYGNGSIHASEYGSAEFGGNQCTADSIEIWLASKGILQTDLVGETVRCQMKRLFQTSAASQDDNRGYASLNLDRIKKNLDSALDEDEDDDAEDLQ